MENTCSICLENISDIIGEIKKTICGHYFHIKCINQWQEKNEQCPICRTKLKTLLDEDIDIFVDKIYPYFINFNILNFLPMFFEIKNSLNNILPKIIFLCKIENNNYQIYKYISIIFFKSLFIFFIYKDWIFQFFSMFIYIFQIIYCKKIKTVKFLFNIYIFLPFCINFFWNITIYPSYNIHTINIYNYEMIRLILFYLEFYIFFYELNIFINSNINDKFINSLIKSLFTKFNIN